MNSNGPDPDVQARASEIFQSALDLEGDARDAFVAEQCRDDPRLADEVSSLLASFGRAGEFLERSALDAADAFWVGRRIGDYELVRLIGRGGVGLVFEARQDRPRRTVALKLLRPELANDEIRRRFDREAELLARLEHPGIARIYGAGTVDTELGPQSFLAMELVDGRGLVAYAREQVLSVRDRVQLVCDVCEAVQHAHDRGVIHRDLKPGNILVDGGGRPRVLDFGVARATNADLDVGTMYTRAGQLVGTVSYMSPEQSRGDSRNLDERTDVYSIGVLLYQLLAGRLPLPVSELPLAEALRTLSEDEPPPLAVVASGIDRDLATVVGKAIERDPARRYRTPAELAADLSRWLADEPVRARPPSTLHHLFKFAVRHRSLVASIGALIVALAAGVVVTALGQHREQQLRLRSQLAEAEARDAQRRSELDAYAANLAVVQASVVASDIAEGRTRLAAAAQRLRGWEWTHLRQRLDRSSPVLDNGSGIESLALAADGRTLITGGTDCAVRAWDVETGELRWSTELGRVYTLRGVALSPSGDLVAASRGSWFSGRSGFGPVTLLSAADGALVAELDGNREALQAFAFHPTRPLLFSAASDGVVAAWDLDELGAFREVARHASDAQDVRPSPDGARVASVGWDGDVLLVDTNTWALERTIATGERLTSVAWSDDGRALAAGTWEGRVLSIPLEGDTPRMLEGRHGGRIEHVAFAPDALAVLSAGSGGTLIRHELHPGGEARTFLGSRATVTGFAFEPGGATIVSGALDGRVRRWDAGTEDLPRFAPHVDWVYDVALAPDGSRLASAGPGPKGVQPQWSYVRIHDVASRAVERELVVAGESVLWSVEFARDGARVATAGTRSGAIVWDVETGERLLTLDHDEQLRCATFDPTGELLVTTSHDEGIRFWNARSGDLVREPSRWETHRPYSARFSPDGAHLAVGFYDGAVALFDARDGERIAGREAAHARGVYALAFAPDGERLVSGGGDQRLVVWDARALTPLSSPIDVPASVYDVAFFPDGARVAVGDGTGVLRIVETEGWNTLVSLRGHRGAIRAISISADGRLVHTGGADGDVFEWDGGPSVERWIDAHFDGLLSRDELAQRIAASPGVDARKRGAALAWLATQREAE